MRNGNRPVDHGKTQKLDLVGCGHLAFIPIHLQFQLLSGSSGKCVLVKVIEG
jgi:hypothetical protein